MNKLFVLILLTFSFLISGQAFAWTIDEFNFKADIQTDGSVEIEEKITADFSSNRRKHGIIRDIPIEYTDRNGTQMYTPISNISVTNQKGENRKFVKNKKGDLVSVKIGDANKYAASKEIYVIKYKVLGALNAFSEHDEFYWNVTGNDWDTSINNVSAIVRLPEAGEKLQAICYTGKKGSTAQNCAYQFNAQNNAAGFKTSQKLNTNEGLTLVFGWDKSLVTIPEKQTKPKNETYKIIEDFVFGRELSEEVNVLRTILGWILSFQFVVILIQIIRSFKRKVHKGIIPKYHPPNDVSLSESGLIYDHKFGPKDITALIVSLCVKGHMIIRQETKENVWLLGTIKTKKYTFVKTSNKASKTQLTEPEQFIYSGIFYKNDEILLSDLKSSWARKSIFKPRNLRALKIMVEKLAHDNDLKLRSLSSYILFPQLLRFLYQTSFIVLLIIAFGYQSVLALAIFILIYVLPILFIPLMVALPFFKILKPKGAQAKHDLRCFAEYIKTAEKDRLEWSEAQGLFEKYLPYAITFGLTSYWVKKFDFDLKQPDWYSSDKDFNITNFTSSMNKVGSSIAAAHSSNSSSGSSGGSSGGGGGGGGGSSW
jgi:uncharacterized membrane protein